MSEKMILLKKYLPEFLLAAAIVCFFVPSLGFPLYMDWDDGTFLTQNPHIALTWENTLWFWKHGMQNLWTPLTMNSLQWDAFLFGRDNPIGYRAVNLFLHLLTALAAFRILRHLGIRKALALGAILLWSCHPQRIESVVWITERKDVLCGFLACTSFLLFMREYDRKRFPILSGLLFCLSLAAKPATFGVLGACAGYACMKQSFRSLPPLRYWLIAGALFLAGAAFAFFVVDFRPAMDPLSRILYTVPHNACFYLTTALLMPFSPDPCYPLLDMQFSFLFLSGPLILLFFWVLGRKAEIPPKELLQIFLGFGICWLLFFLPTAGGFRYNPTDYADRYNYLPGLTFAAFAAFLCEKVLTLRPRWSQLCRTVLLLLFSLNTVQFIRTLPEWESDTKLFFASMTRYDRANPKSIVMITKKALISEDPRMMEAAAGAFLRHLQSPVIQRDDGNLRESFSQTAQMLYISLLCAKGEYPQSWKQFLLLFQRMESKPRLYDGGIYLPWFKRTVLRLFQETKNTGDLPERFLVWSERVSPVYELPVSEEDWALRAAVRLRKGDRQGAAEALRNYLKMVPDDPNAKWNLYQLEQGK